MPLWAWIVVGWIIASPFIAVFVGKFIKKGQGNG